MIVMIMRNNALTNRQRLSCSGPMRIERDVNKKEENDQRTAADNALISPINSKFHVSQNYGYKSNLFFLNFP